MSENFCQIPCGIGAARFPAVPRGYEPWYVPLGEVLLHFSNGRLQPTYSAQCSSPSVWWPQQYKTKLHKGNLVFEPGARITRTLRIEEVSPSIDEEGL